MRKITRRDLLKSAARGGVLAGMAAIAAALARRRGGSQACDQRSLCGQCRQSSACGLPAAWAWRRSKDK